MTSPTVDRPDAEVPFSVAIRDASAQVHHAAERGPLVRRLLRGELPLDAYVAFQAQHHHLYADLEAAGRQVADDPVAGPFIDPALDRTDRLATDLAHLAGPDWAERFPPLGATAAYGDHLADLAGSWPPGLVAHHYVRYLGDLSGGQIIARVVGKAYGITPETGGAFYRFDEIDDVDAYKASYRRRIDALPLHGADRDRFTTEVMAAFEGTGAIYEAVHDATA